MITDTVISKVWSFCHSLRADGVGYGENIEAGLNSFRAVTVSLQKKTPWNLQNIDL